MTLQCPETVEENALSAPEREIQFLIIRNIDVLTGNIVLFLTLAIINVVVRQFVLVRGDTIAIRQEIEAAVLDEVIEG